MKKSPAFTIIEMILVIALSSIVLMGLMQAYNNIMRYLKTIQDIQGTNRKICLLFNQMERDFMAALIPPILKKITPEKEGDQKKDKDKPDSESEDPVDKSKDKDKSKAEEERLETLKKYFIASIDDTGLPKRINDQRTGPFKNVTFINTNPLQVYGQTRLRFVRVMYELVLDKNRSKGENYCYNLWRKETEDLENVKLKEDEVGYTTKSKATQIRKHLVADGIKEMFVQYVCRYKEKDENKKAATKSPESSSQATKDSEQAEKVEEKVYDVWGEVKQTKGVVPNRVNIYITFWDENLSKTASFQSTFPVMSFSLLKEIEKKKEEKKADKDQATGQQPAAAGASNQTAAAGSDAHPAVQAGNTPGVKP